MTTPLDLLILIDEPFHASYLASVLDLEAPGMFRVRRATPGEPAAPAAADLVLVQEGFAPGDARASLAGRMAAAAGAPIIVVVRGGLDLPSLDRFMHEGADDVLDLGALSAWELAAAVLKAVRRRGRPASGPRPLVLGAVPEPAA